MFWLSPRNFSRAERFGVPVTGLVIGALSLIPYFIFYFQTPVHRVYLWSSSFYFDDYFQYYAWARHIAAGDTLIRNYYTHDPATSFALFNPYFLALGWVTRATGNVFFAYHALRIVMMVAFGWVAYAFIGLFIEAPRGRALAAGLLFGGGFEYPFFMLGGGRFASPLADPYVFKILYRYGHLALCLALLLVVFGSHWSQTRGIKSRANPATLALAALLLGLINPYYLVLMGCVLLADTAWLVARGNRAGVPSLVLGGAASIAGGIQYAFQPITSQLGDIAFDDPIGLFDFALFFVFFIPPAVLGFIESLPRANASPHRDLSFLVIWMLVVPALILSPLQFRARMVFGVQFALVIPMTLWIARREKPQWITLALLPFLLIEPAFTFYKEGLDFRHKGIGAMDRSMAMAFQELDRRAGPTDVIVAPALTGVLLPAFTPASVYAGHSFQTPSFYQKQARLNQFYLKMTAGERGKFLSEIGADLVLCPPMDGGQARQFMIADWKGVYDRSGYQIFVPANEPAQAGENRMN